MKSQSEENIYSVISDALLDLCEKKPNDPIDYLSRKMFELNGENPNELEKPEEDTEQIKIDRLKSKTSNYIITKGNLSIINIGEKFEDHYTVKERIYKNIFKVQELSIANNQRVGRMINKGSYSNILLSDKKMKILLELDYPFIIKIYDIFETRETFTIIEDFCPGNDLYSFLFSHKNKVTNSLIREIFRQIIKGLIYLHSNHIIHKYLHNKKILIFKPSLDPKEIKIKIGGLAYCEVFQDNEMNKGYINFQPEDSLYIAPEYYRHYYDKKVDIWNLGIIAYTILIGKSPYINDDSQEYFLDILKNELEFPKDIDPDVKEFLSLMLKKDPAERYDAADLLKLNYFKKEENALNSINIEMMNSLANFKIGRNLRRSIISYIISKKLYEENDPETMKLFETLDVNHDGKVSANELYSTCHLFVKNKNPKDLKKRLKKFVSSVDVNMNGTLEYSEFLAVIGIIKGNNIIQILKQTFDFYDHSNNGYIELADLQKIFEKSDISKEELNSLILQYDESNDRRIDFEEFKNIFFGECNASE